MIMNLKNKSGTLKQINTGFSWTVLFFSSLIPLLRGDWGWFIIMTFFSFMSFGLANVLFAFIYNKELVKRFLKKGFEPADDFSKNLLSVKGIV